MSKKLYEESNLQAIANAIREKNNTQNQYTPSQMPNAILQLHGEPDLETLTVTENGNYLPSANKDGFSEVAVNVPNSYTNSDEGKVVKNGSLISQTPRAAGITENGTYDTTENNSVVVNVSTGSAVVQSLSVTQNGTYTPPSGVDGYAPVTVNVSGGGINWKTQSQWDAMTFAEKKQQGLTLIGTLGDLSGRYVDYANVANPYHLDPNNNIIALYGGSDDFGFHGFYSHTSGDRPSAGGRGVTWNTDDYRVICNALPVNGGFGFYCAFALTQEALAGTNTQYYSIVPVNGYNMFCAGNLAGAWDNNTDVTFIHDGTTKTLQSMYSRDEYTIRFDTYPSDSITFNSSYDEVLSSIYAFLSDYS